MAKKKAKVSVKKTKTKLPAKRTEAALPAGFDYGDKAGIGAEDITSEDFLLPFLRIIQPNSPQLNKRHEKYIKGSEAGMFFNVSTSKLYPGEDGGFTVHLCFKTRSYAEFIPRDQGGGFVGQHEPDSDLVVKLRQKQGKFMPLETGNSTELIETYYAYAVVVPEDNEEEPELVVFPFSSTGITPFKQYLMQLSPLLRKGVPIYAARTRVTTRFRKNTEGEFFVPNLVLDGAAPADYLLAPDDPLLAICAELREGVTTGKAKVDYAEGQSETEEAKF